MESDANPMDRANAAPRCHARSKRTGLPCRAPAVTGWTVCHFHGAGGGHAAGPSHPSWRHGLRSQEWVVERRMLNDLLREAREGVALLTDPAPIPSPALKEVRHDL